MYNTSSRSYIVRSKEQQNTYPLTAAKSAEPIDINHFKFQQWLRQIFAYSADGKVATISSSVTNGGSIELAYTTYNQSAVANLLHEGYLKISPDFSNAWFGHNTWTNFSSMMRIFKEYRFQSNNISILMLISFY